MFKRLDFDKLRLEMVDRQLIPRGIKDDKVIEVFRNIPRHEFIPSKYQNSSYGNFPLPIGEDQSISQPFIVALMTQTLEINNTDKVLEIGTGSGYQAAILASLAKDIYSVERRDPLAKEAENTLRKLGFTNLKLKIGDGTLGWEEFAPYDKIMVTAAAPSLPEPLKEQLNPNGKIVIPIAAEFGQILTLFTKDGNKFNKEKVCECAFVPLIGQYGYEE